MRSSKLVSFPLAGMNCRIQQCPSPKSGITYCLLRQANLEQGTTACQCIVLLYVHNFNKYDALRSIDYGMLLARFDGVSGGRLCVVRQFKRISMKTTVYPIPPSVSLALISAISSQLHVPSQFIYQSSFASHTHAARVFFYSSRTFINIAMNPPSRFITIAIFLFCFLTLGENFVALHCYSYSFFLDSIGRSY